MGHCVSIAPDPTVIRNGVPHGVMTPWRKGVGPLGTFRGGEGKGRQVLAHFFNHFPTSPYKPHNPLQGISHGMCALVRIIVKTP